MSPLPGPRHKDAHKHVQPEPTTAFLLLSFFSHDTLAGRPKSHLALCLWPPAETEALLDLPHVEKGTNTGLSQGAEPAPDWGCGQ